MRDYRLPCKPRGPQHGMVKLCPQSIHGSGGILKSYTSAGALRWQRTAAPLSGTTAANWVAAVPNGDMVVLSSTFNNQASYAITLVRYASEGTLCGELTPRSAFIGAR